MITDPQAVRILCFGDSNTHGAPADDPEYARLPADRRWTGVLQGLLGAGFEVIEEGLSGRTTDLDYEDRPGCNGRDYLVPCLQSHEPLDIVVIMLGTNDLKTCFDRTAETIADSLRGYLDDVPVHVADRLGRTPAVVLVSPIVIDDTAPSYEELTSGSFDSVSVARSHEIGPAIRRIATERGVAYADAADVARAGDDGLHLASDSHVPLARLIADAIATVIATTTASASA